MKTNSFDDVEEFPLLLESGEVSELIEAARVQGLSAASLNSSTTVPERCHSGKAGHSASHVNTALRSCGGII